MKLFNKCRVLDEALEPVLVAAGRAVGARTGNVVVKVTVSRHRLSGMAHQATFVNTWHLKRVKKWSSERVYTDGGWFKVSVPMQVDGLRAAEDFFLLAMHEWVHIKDYQTGKWSLPWSSAGRGGRRPRHDSRPEELRAINAVDDAVASGAIRRNQDTIIALAIVLDSLHR